MGRNKMSFFVFLFSIRKMEQKSFDDSNTVCFLRSTIGVHCPFESRIENTVRYAIDHGMYALQFFLGNPTAFTRTRLSIDDIARTKKLLLKYPTEVFSHFPYVANLAGSKKFLAWDDNPVQDRRTGKLLQELGYELSIMANFDGGVVIHPGNYPDRSKGLRAIAQSIDKIKFTDRAKLLLENSAGQGTSLATTLEEISTIINHVSTKNRRYLGVCLDTCHLYAVGDYDLSRVSEMKRLFTDFDRLIGLKYLSLIHLNDSETKLGSRVDRHANIGTGHIWHKSFNSLKYLLQFCIQNGIPIILETSKIDLNTIEQIENFV